MDLPVGSTGNRYQDDLTRHTRGQNRRAHVPGPESWARRGGVLVRPLGLSPLRSTRREVVRPFFSHPFSSRFIIADETLSTLRLRLVGNPFDANQATGFLL